MAGRYPISPPYAQLNVLLNFPSMPALKPNLVTPTGLISYGTPLYTILSRFTLGDIRMSKYVVRIRSSTPASNLSKLTATLRIQDKDPPTYKPAVDMLVNMATSPVGFVVGSYAAL